jgi:RNA polymerase sigma factor (sigma-70 family)
MDEHEWLAEQFEANRTHLQAVAYRMLGSLSEADDAVQESWLRLSRSDTSEISNLGGWLTTVVARICLDMLRSRKSRREEPRGSVVPEGGVDQRDGIDPEEEMELSDSVGQALLIVLDTLSPAERLAFVLHDLFEVPFNEIAPIVGRSETAARKLASRARSRVREAGRRKEADHPAGREVVDAFLKASREGDFDALLTLLDPDVVLQADRAAVSVGAPGEVRGARAVARQVSWRARGAQPALVNGAVGAVAQRGRQSLVFRFTIKSGKIVEIHVVADPEHLRHLDLVILD